MQSLVQESWTHVTVELSVCLIIYVQLGIHLNAHIAFCTGIRFHFNCEEWCVRKRYEDGDKVTSRKVLAYAKELMAKETYEDKDNPHVSIRPLIVTDRDGCNRRRAKPRTVTNYLVAIRMLYKDQCLKHGEWSTWKQFADGDKVTVEKYVVYATELTAREAYEDENNPHLSIRPLGGREGSRPSLPTVYAYLYIVRELHKEQRRMDRTIQEMDRNLTKNEIQGVMRVYKLLLNDTSRGQTDIELDASGRGSDDGDQSDNESDNVGDGHGDSQREDYRQDMQRGDDFSVAVETPQRKRDDDDNGSFEETISGHQRQLQDDSQTDELAAINDGDAPVDTRTQDQYNFDRRPQMIQDFQDKLASLDQRLQHAQQENQALHDKAAFLDQHSIGDSNRLEQQSQDLHDKMVSLDQRHRQENQVLRDQAAALEHKIDESESDRLRQENQALRDKVASLEQENRALSDRNQQLESQLMSPNHYG
ncbi:hypothetical protein BGX23_004771 [Mortierella sp. AD031]|nr:hypothetical protein BGX23_004771 [Mortierella sp. AD031]